MQPSTQLRDIVRRPFCEYNRVAPLALDGTLLTILAADPGAVEAAGTLALLKTRYQLSVRPATESEVHAQIARVFRPADPEPAPQPAARPAPPPPMPSAPPVDAVGKTCPYCQTPIKPGVAARACAICGMAHHEECWRANNGCTTFGCAGAAAAPTPQTFGAPPPAYGWSPPVSPTWQGRNSPAGYPYAAPVRVEDHMVESILVTIFCCLPIGVASICFSATARSRATVGDFMGAISAARTANTLNIVALVLGLLFIARSLF
ncbi:MAG TPA: CD225/dispanin family protein [Armatimonadota bacterium]|jgi:hypothetical protein